VTSRIGAKLPCSAVQLCAARRPQVSKFTAADPMPREIHEALSRIHHDPAALK
jgi:hypothetical protein